MHGFPLFYSTSFGSAYWVWLLILFTFIIQAVSYEFQNKAGNIVRDEVLQKHPELKDLLDSLTNTITNEDMVRMNYEVETNGREPKDVAHEYLVSKGLV